MERDSIHYSILEDDGYGTPIVCVISPREPGKTTSMVLDKVYASFKRGLPFVVLVNQAADIMEEYLASFETIINKYDGYHIETKYKKSVKDTCSTIEARFDEEEEFRPFIHVIPLSAPLTRLKRLNFGRIGGMWYDECNVNVAIGEKWPADLTTKWNELYTTFCRECYPKTLKFYMTGNYYTRYNPLLVYLGVDCSQLEMGKKILTKMTKTVNGIEVNYSSLVDCYKLKPELVEYILKHNPGYAFDDTYQKYFLGQAIGDEGVPVVEERPSGFALKTVFKIGNRYLYIWKSTNAEDRFLWKYWLQATGEAPGKRRDIYVADLSQLQSGSIFAKGFRNTFEGIKLAIGRFNVSFNNNEAYYLMQQIYSAL